MKRITLTEDHYTNKAPVPDYENSTHRITRSNTHTDLWVFKSKFNTSFFTLTASELWISSNFEVVKSQDPVTMLKFHRTKFRNQRLLD